MAAAQNASRWVLALIRWFTLAFDKPIIKISPAIPIIAGKCGMYKYREIVIDTAPIIIRNIPNPMPLLILLIKVSFILCCVGNDPYWHKTRHETE